MRPGCPSHNPVDHARTTPRGRLADVITPLLLALAAILLLMTAANLHEVRDMTAALNRTCAAADDRQHLRLPTKLVLDDPECAQKMMQAWDIDHVQVSSTLPSVREPMKNRALNRS